MESKSSTKRLFNACCIALVATSMTFAIRADLIGVLGAKFEIPKVEMGVVLGTAFWGFTITTILGGMIVDLLGTKRLLMIAFIGHLAGTILTMLATGFWSLFFSTLLIGMANGFVEAGCNPLIATLYPNQKTKKLNQFHVWFPGGIVIGGLLAYWLHSIEASWQVEIALILIPTLIYGVLFFSVTIPPNENVSKGVSFKSMLWACTNPLYLVMLFCMLLTAATELGTGQWITDLLSNVGVPAILLLVFIQGIMVVGRSFAGIVENSLSPPGMLLFSAIFSGIGLLLLGQWTGYGAFGAAAIFAIGICFFWPTMLGFVSEYIPKTGALGMGLMGGMGMLSVAFILPTIGNLYDVNTQAVLPAGTSLSELSQLTDVPEVLKDARLVGGAKTLSYVAILPGILSIIFLVLFIKRKSLKTI